MIVMKQDVSYVTLDTGLMVLNVTNVIHSVLLAKLLPHVLNVNLMLM